MSRRVLVIDDDAATRERIGTMLQEAGHCVELIADGGEALRRLDHDRPDLILLDLVMPVVDGMAFLVQRRNTAGARDIPVTSAMADAARLLVGTLGVRAALIKPLEPAHLLETMETVLRDSQSQASSA